MKERYICRSGERLDTIIPYRGKGELLGGYTNAISNVQFFRALGLIMPPSLRVTTMYHELASIALVDYIRTELSDKETVQVSPDKYKDIIVQMTYDAFALQLLSEVSEIEGIPILVSSAIERITRYNVSDKDYTTMPFDSLVFFVASSRVLSPYGLGTLTAVIYHPYIDLDKLYDIKNNMNTVASVLSELEVMYILSHDNNTPIPFEMLYNKEAGGYKVYIDAPDFEGYKESIVTAPKWNQRDAILHYKIQK